MNWYRERSRVWLSFLEGDALLQEITIEDVEWFRNERLESVSTTTTKKDLTALSTFFEWCRTRNMCTQNPASHHAVPRPSNRPPNPNPLSDAEIELLLEHLRPWCRPIVEFCIATGADRGEVINLTWDKIDQHLKIVTIPRSKTGVRRKVPYAKNRTIRRILKNAGGDGEGRVFRYEDGSPVTIEGAKNAMRQAWPKAIRGKTRPWKSLRATFATRLHAKGVEDSIIAELMGLTTTHVHEHYIVASGVRLADALEE